MNLLVQENEPSKGLVAETLATIANTSESSSSYSEKPASPKFMINTFDNKNSPQGVSNNFSGQKQETAQRKKGYFAYPKTCGFSWNCYG